MKEWVNIISQDTQTLKLQLKDASWLDKDVFIRMEVDDSCIKGVLLDETRAIVSYTLKDYISLRDVLEQHVFEKEEGYLFIHQLLEYMIAANRNKPVLMDPEFVFVSPYGDDFKFIVVPVCLEKWMVQKEICQDWINYLSKHFKTSTAYEIPGYLSCFLDSDEFSLTNLIMGLDNIHRMYYPQKFSWLPRKKARQSFRVAEPMHTLYKPEEKKVVKPEIVRLEKTMIIGGRNEVSAYLMMGQERYDLISEIVWVGRSMQCDIRLQDASVSLKHAKITCTDDRYYIMDQKSSNGTFLNEKRVQRRMRLKDGMHLRFGNEEAVFHQA